MIGLLSKMLSPHQRGDRKVQVLQVYRLLACPGKTSKINVSVQKLPQGQLLGDGFCETIIYRHPIIGTIGWQSKKAKRLITSHLAFFSGRDATATDGQMFRRVRDGYS